MILKCLLNDDIKISRWQIFPMLSKLWPVKMSIVNAFYLIISTFDLNSVFLSHNFDFLILILTVYIKLQKSVLLIMTHME